MDDLTDEDLESFLYRLRSGIERRRGMIMSYEDIAGTHESIDGLWREWMCGDCGIFMKEDRRRCLRCGLPRE